MPNFPDSLSVGAGANACAGSVRTPQQAAIRVGLQKGVLELEIDKLNSLSSTLDAVYERASELANRLGCPPCDAPEGARPSAPTQQVPTVIARLSEAISASFGAANGLSAVIGRLEQL